MNIWEFFNSIIMGFIHGGSFGIVPTMGPHGHPSYDTGFSIGVLAGVATSVISVILIWNNLA